MASDTDQNFLRFSKSLTDAAELVDNALERTSLSKLVKVQSLPNLLERCDRLCAEARDHAYQPVRTIHHFACTGGTLISKCLASMPNVNIVSEVDPYSRLGRGRADGFCPTDLIELIRTSSRAIESEELVGDIFLAGIAVLHKYCAVRGLRLVLRDHAHSHFCVGGDVAPNPTLRSLLIKQHDALSVMTVRHPVDSYLSLVNNGWRHFTPNGIDEYCRRYNAFLDAHADLSQYRYEEFVDSPVSVMAALVAELQLEFCEDFQTLYPAIVLSGDSGRKGDQIARRSRREIPGELRVDLENSDPLSKLCQRLGYEPWELGY